MQDQSTQVPMLSSNYILLKFMNMKSFEVFFLFSELVEAGTPKKF
jgi:hypothetical protein